MVINSADALRKKHIYSKLVKHIYADHLLFKHPITASLKVFIFFSMGIVAV